MVIDNWTAVDLVNFVDRSTRQVLCKMLDDFYQLCPEPDVVHDWEDDDDDTTLERFDGGKDEKKVKTTDTDDGLLDEIDDYIESQRLQAEISNQEDELDAERIRFLIEAFRSKYGNLADAETRKVVFDLVGKHADSTNDKITIYLILLTIFEHVTEELYERISSNLKSLNRKSGMETYLSLLGKLPFGLVKPIRAGKVRDILGRIDTQLFGMQKAKERLKEYIVLSLFTRSKGSPTPLLLVGPPGTGKTSLAYALSDALGLPLVKFSLGGTNDMLSLRGSNPSWSEGQPGMIVKEMSCAGCLNPVFLLDEVDKAGSTSAGRVVDLLSELLDPKQSQGYTDAFLMFPVDMSKALYVCTANDRDRIPSYLLDRCYIIDITEYTRDERKVIIRDYIPGQIKKELETELDIRVSDKAAEKLSSLKSLRDAKKAVRSLLAYELELLDDMFSVDIIKISRVDDELLEMFDTEGKKEPLGFKGGAQHV